MQPVVIGSGPDQRFAFSESAAIVLLGRGRVSEGLVKVSLAFHLFVVGTATVIFAFCVFMSSHKKLFISSKG